MQAFTCLRWTGLPQPRWGKQPYHRFLRTTLMVAIGFLISTTMTNKRFGVDGCLSMKGPNSYLLEIPATQNALKRFNSSTGILISACFLSHLTITKNMVIGTVMFT